jgi:uncharacterized membrane protein
MVRKLVPFLNTLLAGLLAGALLCIWLGYNPTQLSYSTYREQHQSAVRALNTLMPIVGLITIVLTLVFAFQNRSQRPIFVLLIVAALCLIGSGLVTKLGNQPINALVMDWPPNEVPADWQELRARWWTFHQIRSALCFIAFCLILTAALHNRK